MKFLMDHDRTKQELEYWAGSQRLIFGRFFLWSSSVEFQRSLGGLYRSILFEGFPLVAGVDTRCVSRGSLHLSSKRQEACIDEIFFRQGSIKKAFKKLVTI
jgi:hypothetical protein